MNELMALESEELHLWLLPTEEAGLDDVDVKRLLALLPADEQERSERFVVERPRREYILTRTLVRRLLSQYAAVEPGAWRFSSNAYGRPAIAAPEAPSGLDFNLSHTGGMIVCLLGRGRELGVDVEDRQRARRTLDIAERFFSPREAAALRALAPAAQGDRFMDLWTLKEAYIKARGMGLRIPLAHFSFDLSAAPETIRVTFEPELEDDPASWRFALWRPTARHQLAWAARVVGEEQLTLRRLEALPLLRQA